MVCGAELQVLQEVSRLCSLGVLIKVVRESQMDFIIQKLVALSGSHEGELRDIAGLGAPHSPFLSCGHASDSIV